MSGKHLSQYFELVCFVRHLIMMVLLYLLTFSYLESDSKAEILQRLVVNSSLNVIASATDATDVIGV
jgi:hypothetical protein